MFPFLPMKNLIDLFLIFILDKIDSPLTIYLACRILCLISLCHSNSKNVCANKVTYR
jgi:hypothetical protein